MYNQCNIWQNEAGERALRWWSFKAVEFCKAFQGKTVINTKGFLSCIKKKKKGIGMLPGANDWMLIHDNEKVKPLNSILPVFSVIVNDVWAKKDRMNVV